MGLLSSLGNFASKVGGAIGLPFVGSTALAMGGQALDIWAGRESAEDQRAFNSQQALLDRQFQERMSNTAYSRAVTDMQRAGLNPILAAGGAQASTPGGASAVSSPAATGSSSASLATALSAVRLKQEISNMKALETKTAAEAQNVGLDSELKEQQTNINNYVMDRAREDANSAASVAELNRLAIPSAKAEAQMWRELGEYGSSAKGAEGFGRFIVPFLKMLLPKSGGISINR